MIGLISKGLKDMNENNINTADVHNEMTVGEILRNARTTGRRKREIQTVSKQLCIREEFLQALEDGNYSVIPETVYILGFARNYAMELGLDPDEIVGKLKREMGLEADDKDDDKDDAGENVTDVAAGEKWYKRIWNFIRRKWIWIVGGLLVIIIAAVAVVLFVSRSDVDSGVQNAPVVAPVVTVTEPQYNVTVRERFGTDNAGTASVILQAVQESWVKIEDARGNTVFSRVLVPGDVYYVPQGNEYTAVFGNAGGVDVWVDGVLAPKQGADHVRVADISLAPDDLIKTSTGDAETLK